MLSYCLKFRKKTESKDLRAEKQIEKTNAFIKMCSVWK